MLPLPARFAGIILAFAPLFVHRSRRHAQLLLIGAILTLGRRPVASVLRMTGRVQERRSVNVYRILNRAAWCPRSDSRVILGMLVSAFASRGPIAQSGSGAFTSGSVAIERTLTLGRDGRFRRTGFVGFPSTTETGGGRTGVTTAKDRPTEQGRCEVEGHVITLIGENGQAERYSIFAPDKGSDGLLVIEGSNYLKQDRKK